jgi:hypothetical protein
MVKFKYRLFEDGSNVNPGTCVDTKWKRKFMAFYGI